MSVRPVFTSALLAAVAVMLVRLFCDLSTLAHLLEYNVL